MARSLLARRILPGSSLSLGALAVLLLTSVLWGDPQDSKPASKTADSEPQAADAEVGKPEGERPTIAEARRQAKLLHEVYVTTLHTVHRTYFDEDSRDTIPARAMENVFRDVDRETGGRTRWIAVNTPAMNIDHKPEPGFEKDAARQLAKGDREFEKIEDGVYRRAGAVSLFAGCTKCHLSGIRPQQNVRSVAGLVISIPVKAD